MSTALDWPGLNGRRAATSLTLSSERLGLIARIDRVERRPVDTVPVETKHGRPRRGAAPVRAPELAQIAVQALLLREHGHTVRTPRCISPKREIVTRSRFHLTRKRG